jgi:DNA-3-methyladenine glycosylase II
MADGKRYGQAVDHLARHDAVLAQLITRFGAFTVRPHGDYYRQLVSSIIGQQLSVKAAASIKRRFTELYDGNFPTPGQILTTEAETLRAVGLSRSKALYVQDLARHVQDGRLQVDRLPALSNEEIIHELVAVKGIGEWTAHMFLIFALGRLDVLPVGDLGVRAGMKQAYGLGKLPTPEECRAIAATNQWHPYESVAAWYLWRLLDNEPDTSNQSIA